jgi:hypothetical protein
MPSISETPERHVVNRPPAGPLPLLPRRLQAPDGRLLAAYNEFRQARGRQAPDPAQDQRRPRPDLVGPAHALLADKGHCPRLSLSTGNQLVLSDDGGPTLYWSTDSGENWAAQPLTGVTHGLLDRVLELDSETLLTTGHAHRGSAIQPKIRQAPAEQMLYRSENRGRIFTPFSIIANDPCLVLCEASLLRLPDGPIVALMRENSYVYEPMYLCRSDDNGATWSAPAPTPLIGHRPTWAHGRRKAPGDLPQRGPEPRHRGLDGQPGGTGRRLRRPRLAPAPDNPP